jgi:hypothetical protein
MSAHKQNRYTIQLHPSMADGPKFVDIYHPGCPYRRGTAFLAPPSYAPVPEQNSVIGVDHRAALDACYVLANNQHGSLYGLHWHRLDPLVTPILIPGTYWYQLADHSYDYQYPLVDSFSAWTPSETLLDHWTAPHLGMEERRAMADFAEYSMNMTERVKVRDLSTCVLS